MRTRRTRLLAATGLALAALALTACEDGTGTKDEGARQPASAATATNQAQTPAPGKAAQQGEENTRERTEAPSSKDSQGSKGSKDSKPDAGSAASRVLCNGSNTKVTAQPVARPLNHMLITVKNTGGKVCDLTYYPVLRFDEMQWVPQAAEETKPQAVTTLAPGESGYAGVLLSAADGSGQGGTTGRKLTIAFQGMTPLSSGGASATPPLPAKGVYYDSALTVTYWQREMADALDY